MLYPAWYARTRDTRGFKLLPRTVPNQPKQRSSVFLDPWNAAVHEATHDLIFTWKDANQQSHVLVVTQHARLEVPNLSVRRRSPGPRERDDQPANDTLDDMDARD